MDILTSVDTAKEHIMKIRQVKGLDVLNNNASDLEAALIMWIWSSGYTSLYFFLLTLFSLSEQLYQKSTHFLLELIQNVDDNTYRESQPTLNLTFKKRTLRVDCNEVGFSKENVEAICRIGRSTKAGLNHTSRYIGEKGIRFKSVFKVSDIVWINSGHYSFKFDKQERLGMIAPIWAEFPELTSPGFTSILLDISEDYNTKALLHKLKKLDSKLLIFLQKLRHVDVMIFGDSGVLWKRTLLREDDNTKSNGQQQVITLDNDGHQVLYVITRFRVENMPPEPKREGYTHLEIILTFPIFDLNRAKIDLQ